jgi:hypothetical protein
VTRRRALDEQQAIDAEIWFREYERVGTLEAKARSLNVDVETLRDAIKRVRGQEPRPLRRKLSDAELNQLISDISRGTAEAK